MRVLIADDDARVLASYKAAFSAMEQQQGGSDLSAMAAALFDDNAPADIGTPKAAENSGLLVTYVNQGMAAVEAVKASLLQGDPFQLIFLDMRMPPGINGKETARLIRQADADINIVMVTGYSDSSPSDVAKVAGPLNKLYYVVKPFEIDEILQLTRALSNEWSTLGIRVNAVAPGYIENELTVPLRSSERYEAISARIPLGRWASETEIAEAVAFLIRPEASYICGHTLVVDGGWMGR